MSVVARQGFKYTIIGYLGFIVGALATYFLFPLDFEFYGKLRFILTTAEVLVPLVVFGLSYANIKFFLQAEQDGKHQNLLSVSILGILFNFIIFLGLYYSYYTFFPENKTSENWSFKFLILPLVLVLSLSHVFNRYVSNYKRIVVPNIFENIFPKFANIGAFIIFVILGAAYQQFAYLFFIGMFVISFLGYVLYTNKLEKIQPDFSTSYLKKNKLWKNYLNYSFFSFLGNIGNYVAVRIDNIMIGEYLGMKEVGIYSILFGIVSLISIPQLGLFTISSPIINKSFAENNMEELDRFHKKTSLSLFFLGSVLFSCILVSFPYLTGFIRNGEILTESEPVVWILGIAILFDLATGFNGNIISLSKYYRFNIFIMILLAFLTVILNIYFLKNTSLGIIGIALATAISLSIYNVIKIVFNYVKFKVIPLSIEMMYIGIICTIAITLAIILPNSGQNFVNLVYKPLVVLAVILLGNYFLKFYPLEQYLNKKFLKSILAFKK